MSEQLRPDIVAAISEANDKTGLEKNLAGLAPELGEGETVYSVAVGSFKLTNGAYALTDGRLLFVTSKPSDEAVSAIDLSTVTHVDWRPGAMLGKIVLSSTTSKESLTINSKKDGRILAEALHARVSSGPPNFTSADPEKLSLPLVVLFSLLLCGLIPALPIYLWRKKRIPAVWGIGVSVAMVIGLIAIGSTSSASEDKETPKKIATPAKTEVTKKPTVSAADKKAALIAKAEKIAEDELPADVPFWEGTTVKGTYVSAKKICVDRTMGDGSNGGYVNVSFPKGTAGEPQDGSCAKPAVDYQAKVTKAIKGELGKSNRDDVKRVESVVYNNDAGLGAVVIRWAINDNLTEGLTKKSAKKDVADMLEVLQKLQKDGLKVNSATFNGTFSLVDNLGNTSEDKVVQATYSGSVIKEINFDNFLDKNVYDIAEDVTIHPAFDD